MLYLRCPVWRIASIVGILTCCIVPYNETILVVHGSSTNGPGADTVITLETTDHMKVTEDEETNKVSDVTDFRRSASESTVTISHGNPPPSIDPEYEDLPVIVGSTHGQSPTTTGGKNEDGPMAVAGNGSNSPTASETADTKLPVPHEGTDDDRARLRTVTNIGPVAGRPSQNPTPLGGKKGPTKRSIFYLSPRRLVILTIGALVALAAVHFKNVMDKRRMAPAYLYQVGRARGEFYTRAYPSLALDELSRSKNRLFDECRDAVQAGNTQLEKQLQQEIEKISALQLRIQDFQKAYLKTPAVEFNAKMEYECFGLHEDMPDPDGHTERGLQDIRMELYQVLRDPLHKLMDEFSSASLDEGNSDAVRAASKAALKQLEKMKVDDSNTGAQSRPVS